MKEKTRYWLSRDAERGAYLALGFAWSGHANENFYFFGIAVCLWVTVLALTLTLPEDRRFK